MSDLRARTEALNAIEQRKTIPLDEWIKGYHSRLVEQAMQKGLEKRRRFITDRDPGDETE